MNEALDKTLLDEFVAFGRVEPSIISEIEDKLGLVFPAQYREFLLEFGAAFGSGFEIYGLFDHENDDQPPMWNDVVQVKERERPEDGLSDSIQISGDGMDTTYRLFISGQNVGKIFALGPGTDEVVAESLNDFLRKCMSGELHCRFPEMSR